MTTIHSSTRTHASGRQAWEDMAAVLEPWHADGRANGTITDATALTIASWHQSPGLVGGALAQLASTGSVDYLDLMEDIRATDPHDDDDALRVLRWWATDKRTENL